MDDISYEKDLIMIKKGYNREVYLGKYNNIDSIFKYTDDELEFEILNVVGKPKIYSCKINVTAPSQNLFKILIIQEKLEGLLLAGVKFEDEDDPKVPFIRFYDIPVEKYKNLIIKIIEYIDDLHKKGITYGDDILTNCIISEDFSVLRSLIMVDHFFQIILQKVE